MNKRAGNINR